MYNPGVTPPDLEFPPDPMRPMEVAVAQRCVDHIAALPTQPVLGDTHAPDLCRALREPAPE